MLAAAKNIYYSSPQLQSLYSDLVLHEDFLCMLFLESGLLELSTGQHREAHGRLNFCLFEEKAVSL